MEKQPDFNIEETSEETQNPIEEPIDQETDEPVILKFKGKDSFENIKAEEWTEASQKARDILYYLNSLKGQVSKRTYHEGAANIEKFSNEELVKIILNYNENDWTQHPAYYRALANEMIQRSKRHPIVGK